MLCCCTRDAAWLFPGRLFSIPSLLLPRGNRLVGLVVRRPPRERKVPGSNPACAGIFFAVESYQWLKHGHSGGYPAKRLALQGQRWDWSARCQYTMAGWDGKFDLNLLSQCSSTQNCLCRSVPEIHSHFAVTLSNQPTNNPPWYLKDYNRLPARVAALVLALVMCKIPSLPLVKRDARKKGCLLIFLRQGFIEREGLCLGRGWTGRWKTCSCWQQNTVFRSICWTCQLPTVPSIWLLLHGIPFTKSPGRLNTLLAWCPGEDTRSLVATRFLCSLTNSSSILPCQTLLDVDRGYMELLLSFKGVLCFLRQVSGLMC